MQCNQNQKFCAISETAEKLNFCLITLSRQKYSLWENLKRTIAIAVPGLRSLNRTLVQQQKHLIGKKFFGVTQANVGYFIFTLRVNQG